MNLSAVATAPATNISPVVASCPYGLIKSRLDLENFTGLSAEAIRQDLHATIF